MFDNRQMHSFCSYNMIKSKNRWVSRLFHFYIIVHLNGISKCQIDKNKDFVSSFRDFYM